MSEKKPAPYIRRRAYSKIHVTSWVIYLEKDGFVRCSFKNCNFMAFDVEEMCNHYGFCTGANSTAKHVCEYCKGCTDEKRKLDLHLARAHNVITPVTEAESEPIPSEPVEKSKPSRVLQQSWNYFYEQYNYIKCPACDYLANTLSEMCRHYVVCNSEREQLLYVCSECKGRTMSVNPMLWHLERSHKIFRAPNQFNHITKSMVRYWEREIEAKGYACCLHINKGQRDCFYFDLKILGIVEHSQCCKGPNFATVKVQCPLCRMWTSTAEMLQFHINSDYHRNEGNKSSQCVLSTNKSIKAEPKDQSLGHCAIVTTLPNQKHKGLSTSFTFIEADKNLDEDIEISIIDEVTEETDNPSDIYIIEEEELKNTDSWKNQTKSNKNIYIAQHDVSTKICPLKTKVNQEKDHLIVEDIQSDTEKNENETHSLGCNNKKVIVVKNSNETSKLSLKSMQKTPVHEVRKIIEQKKLICHQNEQYETKVKDLDVDVVEEQNILYENQRKYAPKEVVKEVEMEYCDVVIDYEEQQNSNNARFVKTYNKKPVNSGATLSTTSQDNPISINILKDWNESDEEDSESFQAENSDRVQNPREEMIIQEVGEGGGQLVKCSNEGEGKLKCLQQEKMQKAHAKQPRLFEDELLSDDDDDAYFCREENIESEVKRNLPFDHKRKHLNDKVIAKYYLKRQGSSDLIRPSCSKRPNTSLMESNMESEHKAVEDADVSKCSEAKSTEKSCGQENISHLESEQEKLRNTIDLKSDSNQCSEIFVNNNTSKVNDERSKNSEKNDKLMLDKIISVEDCSQSISPNVECELTKDSTISEISHMDVIKSCCDDIIIEKQVLEKLPENHHQGSPNSTSSQGNVVQTMVLRRKGDDAIEKEKNSVEESQACSSSEFLVSFISKGKLNKSLFEEYFQKEEVDEHSTTKLTSMKDCDKLETKLNSNVKCYSNNKLNPNNHSGNKKGNLLAQNAACLFNGGRDELIGDSRSSDTYRRISSEWSDDSSMDEEFLGTDEELDMKDCSFNGFQEISEASWSHRRNFHKFLNRLSESETEEWYINAGSLSMEIKKEERGLLSNSSTKAHPQCTKMNQPQQVNKNITTKLCSQSKISSTDSTTDHSLYKLDGHISCSKTQESSHIDVIKPLADGDTLKEYHKSKMSLNNKDGINLDKHSESVKEYKGKSSINENNRDIGNGQYLIIANNGVHQDIAKKMDLEIISCYKQDVNVMTKCIDKKTGIEFTPDMSSTPMQTTLKKGVENNKGKNITKALQPLHGKTDTVKTTIDEKDHLATVDTPHKNTNSDRLKINKSPNNYHLNIYNVAINSDNFITDVVEVEGKPLSYQSNVSHSVTKRKRGRPPNKKPCEIVDFSADTEEMICNHNAVDYRDLPVININGLTSDERLMSIYSEEAVNMFQNNNKIVNSSELSHEISSSRPDSLVGNVPKKRGRPPKTKTIHTNEITSTIEKKKRGRPDKLKNDEDISFISESTVDSKLDDSVNDAVTHSESKLSDINNKSGCKPKSEIGQSLFDESSELSNDVNEFVTSVEGSNITDNESTPSIVKKRRGRPPKIKTEKSLLDEVANLNNDVSDRNALVEGDDSANNEITPSIVKKKRGRPPKVTTEQSMLDEMVELSNDENDTKVSVERDDSANNEITPSIVKRRGRPPKVKTEQSLLEIEISNDESETKASVEEDDTANNEMMPSIEKKRRGRPPKIKTKIVVKNESTGNCDDTSVVIKKKRGRPPGKSPLLKKRGRPPKSTTVYQSSTSDSLSHKRKRVTNKYSYDAYHREDSKNGEINNKHSTNSQLLGTDIILINETKLSNKEDGTEYSNEDDSDSDFEPRKNNKSSSKHSEDYYRSDKRSVEDTLFIVKHKTTDMVKCGVCKDVMSYQQYREHAMHKHYMLAWLDGEEPALDMNNDKEVLKRLWYTKKRVRKILFRCFNCNLPKLSAEGFLSHIKFCGTKPEERESLLWTCNFCGAKMMPSSMRAHLYTKHNSGTPNAKPPRSIDQTVVIPKAKRAAANKAVEIMQNHAEENGAEPEENSKSRPLSPTSKASVSHLYTKPNKIIPKDLFRKVKATLQEELVVNCQFKDCSFKVSNTVAFRKHYFNCPHGPQREFKCRPCSFTSKSEKEIQEHVMAKHEMLIHNHQSDNSDKSDNSDSETKPNSYNPSLYFKFLQQPRAKFRGHPRKLIFTEALKWTLKLREKKLTKEVVFSEAQVNTCQWQPLAPDMATSYLPSLQTSMQFRGKDKTWHTLRRFEGSFIDGVPMIFAGGPVWASAWAPVPDSGGHQFLAVATHPNMNLIHEMSSVYSYKSLIQVWCFGHLNNIEPDSGETPKFLLGLAHNRGAVWALRWCPAGCHDDTRLGLLAAACSDGTIPVYCVPRYRYTFEFTIYDVKPVLELKLGCEMLSQCTSIDWHSVRPHKIIAGGFTNGMVALWDLSTSSSLLKDGNTIYPFKVIEAHLSAITAVCLSPTDVCMYLMTASLDRATKFWKLDDTTAPVNTLRKASVMDAVMPSNWLTSINGYDDVYSLNSLHVSGYNYRETYTVGNTNYFLQPGTIWSVSFNDWLNACACASELGRVTVFFRKQLLVTEDSKKIKNNSLVGDIVLYSAQPLDSSKEQEAIGQCYNECVAKIGLDINFKEELMETNRPPSACSSDCMDQYPILSVNKVAWNPNYNSFTWLAVGMQCGLVMAPRVKCVPIKDLTDLYKPDR